jgi:deazaflavin-dependent oxidoreductase (nitroreductase family)
VRQSSDENNPTDVTKYEGMMTSTQTTTSAATPVTNRRPASAPAFVRRWNPLMRAILRLGVPMGPNALLTVKGRTTGQPRTAPVALAEIDGRQFVIGVYGEVHWVRNLRAAGEADIVAHGRTEHVLAIELDQAAATAFYRDSLGGYVARMPRPWRIAVRGLMRLIDARDVLSDPERAAATRPVFELRAASSST